MKQFVLINGMIGVAFILVASWPGLARSQGCVLTHSMATVPGTNTGSCMEPGDFQLSASYRHFKADKHYSGGSGLAPAMSLNNGVISKTQALQIDGSYTINKRFDLTFAIPYSLKASSNFALPSNIPNAPRYIHTANGLGDVNIGGRYRLLDCEDSPEQNLLIGLSLKMPTGESAATDLFPNAAGQDIRTRVVEQAIQPGDGGWGFTLSFEAYKVVGDFLLFASGNYVFNPQGQNDTLSPSARLAVAGPTAVAEHVRYNSIGDSYLVRAGAAYPIAGIPGLSLSFAGRIVGVPQKDLLGNNIGYRRPGYWVSVDPGISYSTGNATFAFTAPVRVHQYIANSFGSPRGTTFADYMLEFAVVYLFGRE